MRPHSIPIAATFLLLATAVLAQAPATVPPASGAPQKKPVAKVPPKKPLPPPAAVPAPVPAPAPVPQAAAPAVDPRASENAIRKERAELEQLRGATVNLIRALVQEGVISKEKAEQMLLEADRGALDGIVPKTKVQQEGGPAAPAMGGTGLEEQEAASSTTGRRRRSQTVRVPYIPETVKNEIRDQVREDVVAQAKAERWGEPGALPEWLDRITWEGDMRLRYQGNFFQPTNTPALQYNAITGADLDNTTTNTGAFVYRARLGMLAKINESWTGGFRLTTGNATNPVSTNQVMGNYFNRASVTMDLAYLRWDQNQWTVSGGRMLNPYFHTNIVWDEDLTFDGAYGTYRPRFSDALLGFFTVGGHIVQYQSPTTTTPEPKTKYLLGLQAGGDWEWSSQGKLRFGVAFYDYYNVQGIPNTTLNSQGTNWTAPAFRQKGNTVFNIDNDGNPGTNLYALASKFQIINLTGNLDLTYFEPFNILLIGDYAKNLGFNQQQIQQQTGLTVVSNTVAWRTGLVLGKRDVRARHDWQAFVDYRYVGADSVLDAFNDSDFNLGGTNAKGYTIGFQYGVDRNVWTRVRWMSADEIAGPPLSIDVLQVDLNARF